MLSRLALLGLLALWLCAPVAAQSDIQARIRNLKLQDAALRAVEESMDALVGELADPEALAGAMLEDPARHREPATSRTLLREVEAERLRAAFRRQLERFARHVDALPPEWVNQTLGEHQDRVEAAIDPLLDGPFAGHFQSGRDLAVDVQARTLEADAQLVPAPAAVESLVEADTLAWLDREELGAVVGGPAGDRLVANTVAAVTADTALFAENEAVLAQWTREALAGELVALQRQLQQVQAYQGGAEVSREAMEEAITAGLGASPAGVVFPGVERRAAERAAFLEMDRFRDHVAAELDPARDCPALTSELVAAQLGGDFRQWPASLEAHLAELREQLGGTVADTLIAGYRERPGGEVAGFGERLRGYLADSRDASAGQVLALALARCLEPILSARREDAARVEMAERHPTLARGDLELQDDELAFIRQYSLAELENLDVPSIPDPAGLHLDETRERFRTARRATLEEGQFALDTQLNTVTWHQAEFTEKVKADPEREANREQWQQAYEERVHEDWRAFWEEQAADPASPVLAAAKYDRLFTVTKELIADLLPTEWEPEATETEEEQTPEQPPQGGCEAVVDSCLQAAVICAEAAQACQAGGCESPLVACRGARERCEAASRAFKSQQATAPPGAVPMAQMCTVEDF